MLGGVTLCNIIYYMASSSSAGKINQIARCDWLEGKMEPSCPLGTIRCIPQAKYPQKPYNKSFDQLCSVKMAGYWPRSFFCEFIDFDFVSVHKHAKKELGQYPAILTSHLVNNPIRIKLLVVHINLRGRHYLGTSRVKIMIVTRLL